MLKNEYLLAKIGFDTAEKEHQKGMKKRGSLFVANGDSSEAEARIQAGRLNIAGRIRTGICRAVCRLPSGSLAVTAE